ncbi:hypothetical protein N7456_009444 [Penicillium angulare]|uniref:Uncharacterized protein n=1 Tax=Penicillium angulare TaxID=116970 RepID=A0A9W9K564_9EURO|nr:hypothetical protein N7456_009444 [Penicillium angulare]
MNQVWSRGMEAPFNFELNGLYILLFDRGGKSFTFHWSLYLHQTETSGYTYQLLNDGDSPFTWYFDSGPSENIKYSDRLLVALPIGVLNPILHKAVHDRLSQIPITYSTRFDDRITCRVWLKEALFILDDEGYIGLLGPVNGIEAEATSYAIRNKGSRLKGTTRSTGIVA